MHFAFTDEQLAFRDAVRDLLAAECPPAAVRAAWTNATGRTTTAWAALGEMGVLGMLVPESAGGLGLTELDAVLVAEETGRAALPEPFVEHAFVGAPLVASEDAAAGAVTVTAGHPLVPYADSADLLVVGAASSVVTRDAATIEPCPSVDASRRLARVTVVGHVREIAPEAHALASRRGVLGLAAQLLGLGCHLLDTTVEYVGARRQFGVPVGSFQAVKHPLADVRIALEFAAPLVYRAAYSLAHADPDAGLHVSMAKAAAGDAATLAARRALQGHGAIGYSFEHDLHRWMKRAWALAAAGGDAAWHRDQVARAMLA